MSSSWIHLVWLAGVGAWIWYGFVRSREELTEILKRDLAGSGFVLLRSEVPARYVTGPFPQGVTEFGKGGTWAPYHAWQYRRVTLGLASGENYVVWARIFFGSGRPPEVDWVPPLNTLCGERGPVQTAGQVPNEGICAE
ncbi:MAG: hypothetical protein HN919_01415 [Verrucomicrobia bacterium]|nr:hypothetical protein [Verrucomicrobiota bacterium]